jgi:hypothetical protein
VFAVHDTISNQNPSCHSDVVLEHCRRVAGSLTFGKTPIRPPGLVRPWVARAGFTRQGTCVYEGATIQDPGWGGEQAECSAGVNGPNAH